MSLNMTTSSSSSDKPKSGDEWDRFHDNLVREKIRSAILHHRLGVYGPEVEVLTDKVMKLITNWTPTKRKRSK